MSQVHPIEQGADVARPQPQPADIPDPATKAKTKEEKEKEEKQRFDELKAATLKALKDQLIELLNEKDSLLINVLKIKKQFDQNLIEKSEYSDLIADCKLLLQKHDNIRALIESFNIGPLLDGRKSDAILHEVTSVAMNIALFIRRMEKKDTLEAIEFINGSGKVKDEYKQSYDHSLTELILYLSSGECSVGTEKERAAMKERDYYGLISNYVKELDVE